MLRSRISLVVVIVAALFGLTAAASQAQDYPGSTVTTSTTSATTSTTAALAPCTTSITFSAPALPGASVTMTATCPQIVGGKSYGGSLQSTPLILPVVVAQGQSASYRIKIPSDFELNAFHTATVTDASTGAVVLKSRFFIDGNGLIASGPSTSNLARTGGGHTGDLVKGGVALVALGALTLAVRRRRALRTT